MKVTATQMGYFDHHIKEIGAKFHIPDKPARKITKDDDKVTQQAAVKGEIPCAFSSHWMRPGWAPKAAPEPEAESDAKSEDAGDSPI